ncbi:capsid protein [Mesorhizobium xinjiangense]|uniref:capsid protein n=1 Tax=Mesorhizobium xinjiangense TaxID=2678685 RepID=UPI0012ECF8A5|nr:capsid protein [Mesorhizobium xinjiangense]
MTDANRPFPTDATLTAIAIGYKNRSHEMIHKQVLPEVPVLSERFSWLSYPIAEAFTVPEMEVGRRGRVNEVEFTAVEHEGKVRDYGLDDVIPITDIDEAARARKEKRASYDPEAAAVEGLTNLVELGREIRAARLVQDADNYDAGRRLVIATATDKFSDFANSDPFEVLNAGIRKPLVHRANTVSMGEEVWETLKRHPKLIKAVKGGQTEDGAISRAQFAELMEIDPERLLIGVSMVNTAPKGKPVSLTKVWGNSIQMHYVDEVKRSPEDNVLTWGFTAKLGQRLAGKIDAPEVGLKGGRRVRVGESVTEVVCASSLGYIIENPI